MATRSSSEVDMGHWLYRLIAYIIDGIIIGIPAYVIYYFVILSAFLGGGWLFWYGGAWWLFWLLLPLVFGILDLLYFTIMEVSYGGATIGKKVLGLQVQMVNGSKVTFDKSILRNITKILGPILLIDWIVGIATPGPDKRQKYTDRMAGTTVVQVKQAFGAAAPPPPPPPPPTV